MQEHKIFRDRNAGRYDRFMRKDWAAYSSRENEGGSMMTLDVALG